MRVVDVNLCTYPIWYLCEPLHQSASDSADASRILVVCHPDCDPFPPPLLVSAQVKAWCYYESRVLGAHHGLISTYALETLVLFVFNVFHPVLGSPLQVRRCVCVCVCVRDCARGQVA